MGAVLLIITTAVISYSWGKTMGKSATTSHPPLTSYAAASDPKIDFSTQVEPILKSRCQGCHFRGGKMYDKLPFDRPETIKHLGTKLFTRISDENDRKVIREFLSQE
jgi:hypothetical protein